MMPIEILMPTLSPTMKEGTISKWLVSEGDSVESGQLIAEIETDKATIEFEAADDGVIGKILYAQGSAPIKVNTPIAILLEEGEEMDEKISSMESDKTNIMNETALENYDKNTSKTTVGSVMKNRIFATPLARRIAKDLKIDLTTITGSGPHGRIIKSDVIKSDVEKNHPKTPPSPDTPKPALQSQNDNKNSVIAPYKDREYTEIPLDTMRRVIAKRLVDAKQNIPHFYLRRSVSIDRLIAVRHELNTELSDKDAKISINDFIIKASGKALQDIPTANVIWSEDCLIQFTSSDVAVAVAVENGLFTPILRDTQNKSLNDLSHEMKYLAKRARDKKLIPAEYQGGSFAISNLGMMGVENFDAVINPPHSSILAVGAGIKKAIVDANNELSVATMMSMTLSVDHRAIDGALGAEFLGRIAYYLENPLKILR